MRPKHRPLRYETLENRKLLAAVQIPHTITTDSAEQVTVPVEIENALGVRAAEIRIDYETSALDVAPSNITAGSVWQGRGAAIAHVDEPAGTIVLFVFSTESLAGQSGSLVDITFNIRKDACVTAASIDLTEVQLNEGQIELTLDPVVGIDGTDGGIAIESHHRLESVSPVAERKLDGTVLPSPLARKDDDIPSRTQVAQSRQLEPTIVSRYFSRSLDDNSLAKTSDLLLATTDRWL